jgi:hypothetical protein
MTSGTRHISTAAINADRSYTVRITATDSLGNTEVYYQVLPSRKWAMKFRADGNGVAFGKAAEYDKSFEIADDWYMRRGTDGYIPTVRTGYIASGDSLDIASSSAFIVLSYSSNHCAIYNCLGSSITRIAGTATSSVEASGSGYRVTNTGSGTLRYFILTLL